MTSLFTRPGLKAAILISVFIVLIYFFLAEHAGLFQTLRFKGFDFLARVKHVSTDPPGVINDVVIIEIDDETINSLGKRWPWDRTIFANLIDKLTKYEPRLICLDILFVGRSSDESVDKELARALRKGKNALLASSFDITGKYVKPLKIFGDSAAGIGFVDFLRDHDFVVRKTRPVMFSKKGSLIDYSLPIKTASLYLGVSPENIFYTGKSIVFKNPHPPQKSRKSLLVIPLANGNELRMNYLADRAQTRHIPFYEVVEKRFPRETFEDKLVVVGVTSESAGDIYPSPLGMMSGLLMNVNCMLMLLDQNFIRGLPQPVNMTAFFLISILVCVVTYRVNVVKRELLGLVVLSAFLGLSYLGTFNNYQIDLFGGLLVIASSYIVTSVYKYISIVMENMSLKNAAVTDALTGLYVYRYFGLKLRNEFKRAVKEGAKLALVIIDVDHFKDLNNKYGNKAGDSVLKEIAGLIKENCRRRDVVARYGGEEIVIVLIDTGIEGAYICTKKIHKAISEHKFALASGESLSVTVSMGVASLPHESIGSKEELLEGADKALYKAKNTGRNKICIFGREENT